MSFFDYHMPGTRYETHNRRARLMMIQRRIRILKKIMPISEAIRLILTEHLTGQVEVRISGIPEGMVLRRGTTDLQCLEKVFLDREYEIPFDVDPTGLIVDAGANIGMATLFFRSKYSGAHIVAIEPESSNFKILAQNCQDLANITLIHGALWSESRDLKIRDPNAEAWAFTVTEAGGSNEASDLVAGVSIPQLLQQLGRKKIALLKVDIEGAEVELFSRNIEAWLSCVEVLVIELHDRMRPGCAQTFYNAIIRRSFSQEIRGENICILFKDR